MTIEEAIEHSYAKADENMKNKCIGCANEHIQLARWLEELVELRAIYEGLSK